MASKASYNNASFLLKLPEEFAKEVGEIVRGPLSDRSRKVTTS